MTDLVDPISIPEARQILRDMAEQHDMPELAHLADRMVRRKPKYPVARPRRKDLTPELAEEIRQHKKTYPHKSHRDIGRIFGVDGGRVSEAIHYSRGM